jgi:high affinity Mn2+ porin
MTLLLARLRRAIVLVLAVVVGAVLGAHPAAADETSFEYPSWYPSWAPRLLGAQFTLVGQSLLPLHSPYAGPNSLPGKGDGVLSETYGIYFGAQVTRAFQIYADVEMARGSGVGGAVGLGGYVNGEVIRQGTTDLGQAPYLARLFGRYVFPLSESTEPVAREMDHLPGQQAIRRMEVKLGKMALPDDFDLNRYANSARTQFLNWSLFNNTAWDFAADTRGYSNGLVVAYIDARWALRVGSYQMPTRANGNELDDDLWRARGDNVELTLQPTSIGTVVRLLGFVNQARMGDYREALRRARATGTTPSITADERPGRVKYGFTINLEQPLADDGDTGLFARGGWNDGRTESFAFTEVDRHLSVGIQVSGARWARPDDRLGVAYAVHWLSSAHRDYLAAGGKGFMLGDGRLDYGTERTFEMYYRFQPIRYVQLGPDFQYVANPGYNRDRGPAFVVGGRLRVVY